MSKLIVTHINPDPDAITSVWLLRRFHPDFDQASVAFVPAGNTYKDQMADSDPDIVHVDTGLGEFDHHHTNERTCAAKLVLDWLQLKLEYMEENEALERLVEVIIDDDHFEDCYWPEPTADRYNFMFGFILDGLKKSNLITDHGLIDLGSTALDGIYNSLKRKVEAEKEIEQGQAFQTPWGQGIALQTKNDEVMGLAQKMAYVVVVRRDPESGMIRIKAQPRSETDLTQAAAHLRAIEPKATWFLHASKKMLLNGSYKNPQSVFSKLPLREVVDILTHTD